MTGIHARLAGGESRHHGQLLSKAKAKIADTDFGDPFLLWNLQELWNGRHGYFDFPRKRRSENSIFQMASGMPRWRSSHSDNVMDFGGITNVWCKFMFPYKVNTRNVYPYYQWCNVRNFRNQFFCYDPTNHTQTANTFITAFYDDDQSFWVYRPKVDDDNLYKCCKTPPGYYIDYVSCYYIWLHDQYWEYYDSQFFLTNCATGYVMTGLSKKLSPISNDNHLEWVQCCRVGYGAVIALPPPTIQTPNGGSVAYSSATVAAPETIPDQYAHQYRGKRSTAVPTALHTDRHTILAREIPLHNDSNKVQLRMVDHDHDLLQAKGKNLEWQPAIDPEESETIPVAR